MFTKNLIRSLAILVSMLVLAFPAPAIAKTQNSLDVESIDAYVEKHMAENQIPGLALSIIHNDEIVYTQGYGDANPDGTPVTPQTPFIIGSTSKSFAALAIMQLVEADEIELDASVQTYLPWFTMAGPQQAKQITVRHLLTHTSGLVGSVSDKDIINPDVSENALETHIRELADYNLLNPIGDYHYINTNYDILGLIVQTISGQSFEDYIEEHIYSPLEMTNSYVSKSKAEANGLAVGHTYFFGSPRVSADAPYSRRKMPSGFLISSAEDLGHYLIAQLNQGSYGDTQLLSPKNVALMHKPAVEASGKDAFYAFGWGTIPVDGDLSVKHEGNTGNFHSNMAFSPARGWGAAIVMNVGGLPKSAALNEPINEVLRLSSGHDAGQPKSDFATVFLVIWGLAILTAGLKLVFWWFFRWRMNKGGQRRLVRHLLLPLGTSIALVWMMFVAFPSSNDSSFPVMRVFLPDTNLIFVISTGIILLTNFLRLGVYLRSPKESEGGAGREKPEKPLSDEKALSSRPKTG